MEKGRKKEREEKHFCAYLDCTDSHEYALLETRAVFRMLSRGAHAASTEGGREANEQPIIKITPANSSR
jgi:hypothetical protein